MEKDNKPQLEVTTDNGKYTVILPADGGLKALRYGEKWQDDLCGNGLVLTLAQDLESTREELAKANAIIEQRASELNEYLKRTGVIHNHGLMEIPAIPTCK